MSLRTPARGTSGRGIAVFHVLSFRLPEYACTAEHAKEGGDLSATRQSVLARLHLGAVLPLLEDIVAHDPFAREQVSGWNLTLQFQLPGGRPATALVFKDGALSVPDDPPLKGGPQKVPLTFQSAAHLNAVFQGTSKRNPRPGLAALLHLKELTGLNALLSRLAFYMKPSDELLRNPEEFRFCVMLNLYGLVFGIRQIGENDPDMVPVSRHIPRGIVEFRVMDGGPAAHLRVASGRFLPGRGPVESPNAVLEIADCPTAWAMLQGRLDLFSAVGAGIIRLRGYIPLLDGINPLMDRLAWYLGSQG